MKVPENLQIELALLWRTLSIIKNIEGLSVASFYEKFVPVLKTLPKLSLSPYWDEGIPGESTNSIVGIPNNGKKKDGGQLPKKSNFLLGMPELDYLKHEDAIDFKHDPLQLIQNLYGVAAMYIQSSTTVDRDILLSACLIIAIKSGRASLLLHFAGMLASLNDTEVEIDIDILEDICRCLIDGENKTDTENSSERRAAEDSPFADALDELTMGNNSPPLAAELVEINQPCFSGVDNTNLRSRYATASSDGILLTFGKADHGMAW